MSVVISGLGQVSALGQGVENLRRGLIGEQAPNIESQVVSLGQREVAVPVYRAPEVELSAAIPESVRRRMPRVTKICFASAMEAIGGNLAGIDPKRFGLVIGTAFGTLDQASAYHRRLFTDGPAGASPTLFASSVHNSIASHLSIALGIRGPSSTVTSMDQTPIGSLRVAYDWIKTGVVDHALVSIGDEASVFHSYAMAHLPSGVSSRLDPKSDDCSAIIGEGFVSFLLSRESMAPRALARLEEISWCVDRPQIAGACFASSVGRAGQRTQLEKWLGRAPESHAHLFGSMATGLAFEVAVGALLVEKSRESVTCAQISEFQEGQLVRLGPVG